MNTNFGVNTELSLDVFIGKIFRDLNEEKLVMVQFSFRAAEHADKKRFLAFQITKVQRLVAVVGNYALATSGFHS